MHWTYSYSVRMSVHFDSLQWTRHIFTSSTVRHSAVIFELYGLSSFHEYLAINLPINDHAWSPYRQHFQQHTFGFCPICWRSISPSITASSGDPPPTSANGRLKWSWKCVVRSIFLSWRDYPSWLTTLNKTVMIAWLFFATQGINHYMSLVSSKKVGHEETVRQCIEHQWIFR